MCFAKTVRLKGNQLATCCAWSCWCWFCAAVIDDSDHGGRSFYHCTILTNPDHLVSYWRRYVRIGSEMRI